MSLNRRSFLLGSGLTAAGLVGASVGHSGRVEAAPIASGQSTGIPDDATFRSCRPKDSLKALIQGNQNFVAAWQKANLATSMAARAAAMSSLWTNDCYLTANELSTGQAPWAAILSCADSRVSPEWIFDAVPSDLFVIRSAGNTAFDDAIASLEYCVAVLETPLIMVMGHSACGAVKAARDDAPLTPLLEQLVTPIRASLTPGESIDAAIAGNARYAAGQLTKRSQVLADAVVNGNLTIVVSTFDIQTGQVTLL